MKMKMIAAAACVMTTAFGVSAQAQTETGSGNPTLTCTQFLDMDDATQKDAVTTLMAVGSQTMPDPDAGNDTGDVGNLTASDAAAAPDNESITDGTDGAMTNVSDDTVRAIVNICNNSAVPG